MTGQYAVTSTQAEAARLAIKRNRARGVESSPELKAIANAKRLLPDAEEANRNGQHPREDDPALDTGP